MDAQSHNANERMLKHFEFEHLPEQLQQISRQAHDLAHSMDALLPVCAETTAGLRKLLEAKDCFVRAGLDDR